MHGQALRLLWPRARLTGKQAQPQPQPQPQPRSSFLFGLYSTGFMVRGVVVFSSCLFRPERHYTKVNLVVWCGVVSCRVVSCLYPTETAFRHSVILSPFGNTWFSSCVGIVLVGWGALSVLPCSGISCYVWYRAIYPIEYQGVGRNQVHTCPPPLLHPHRSYSRAPLTAVLTTLI